MTIQIIEVALKIARKRRRLLDQMRAAVNESDKDAVFELARKLTGVANEECDRANPRIN